MKKRLRKKLHLGEFKELGFSFEAKFKVDADLKQVEEWLQQLAVLLNAHELEMGGGWNSDVCGGFITCGKGSITQEEREIVKSWMEENRSHIHELTVGELKDAWYGW